MDIFLETERMVLRRFTETDLAHLIELESDPAVMRFINGGKATPADIVQAEVLPRLLGYYERYTGFGFWAAIERQSEEFLGWFHLFPVADSSPEVAELGYRLRRSAWGKGYATEGSRALIHRGFTALGVERVVAYTMAVNRASRRVMEKAGLTHVRTFHQDWPDPIDGAEQGEVEYSCSR